MDPRTPLSHDIPFDVMESFPFDIIEMRGIESADFLHRISTNDFSDFPSGAVRKTLLISDKGRMIDAVWVINEGERLLLLTSRGMGQRIVEWLSAYIIMENIHLINMTDQAGVTMSFGHSEKESAYRTDFFSHPVSFEMTVKETPPSEIQLRRFEEWRIRQGIPASGKELVQDYNPLELHLWNWISFTKGCYIGQEVIARLDTYNKIQRALYRFSSNSELTMNDTLSDAVSGQEIGKITSIVNGSHGSFGLAVVRSKDAATAISATAAAHTVPLLLEPLVHKGSYGRN